jgi:uncharacterized protein (TIGR00288 family)
MFKASLQMTTQNVALLVDGENIPYCMAPKVLDCASRYGDLIVRRVYGNTTIIGKWPEAPGFRAVHTQSFKNSADILLSIEAVDMACHSDIQTFVIATSDCDFSHIATYLREHGKTVVGVGDIKVKDTLGAVCSKFVPLCKDEGAKQPKPARPNVPPADDLLNQNVAAVIKASSVKRCLKMQSFGQLMGKLHGVRISEHPKKNWRAYLGQYPDIFQLDPRGPNACVHLKN